MEDWGIHDKRRARTPENQYIDPRLLEDTTGGQGGFGGFEEILEEEQIRTQQRLQKSHAEDSIHQDLGTGGNRAGLTPQLDQGFADGRDNGVHHGGSSPRQDSRDLSAQPVVQSSCRTSKSQHSLEDAPLGERARRRLTRDEGVKAYIQNQYTPGDHTRGPRGTWRCNWAINSQERCEKVFVSRSSFNQHYRYHEKPHACGDCDKRYGDTKDLKRHMVSHSNLRHHPCPYCVYSAKRPDHLKRHVLRIHSETDKSSVETASNTSSDMTGPSSYVRV